MKMVANSSLAFFTRNYKRVAEIAAAQSTQVGDFQIAFLNALQQVSEGERA